MLYQANVPTLTKCDSFNIYLGS